MKKCLSLVSLFLLMFPVMALAADFRTESVGSGENVRNLFIAGQNVNIDANVGGDVTAAGNTVNLNGQVEKAVQLAGSNINLKGAVGDNARIAGGTVNIDGNIGEDLVVVGGQINVGQSSTISHDIIIASGNAVINGRAYGKLVGTVGEIVINGTINGDVDLKEVGKITLGNKAVINGKLIYSAKDKSNINEGQVKGGVQYNQINRANNEREGRSFMFGFSIFALIGSFLLLYLLVRVAPASSATFLSNAFVSPWANMGIGFVVFFTTPIALFILLVSMIGIPIAGIGFLAYLLLIALSGTLMGLIAGTWLVRTLGKKKEVEINWLPILVGVITVMLLKFIPIIGWMVLFLIFLWSVGTLTRMLYNASILQRK